MVGSIGDIIERDQAAWLALLKQAVAAERERCAALRAVALERLYDWAYASNDWRLLDRLSEAADEIKRLRMVPFAQLAAERERCARICRTLAEDGRDSDAALYARACLLEAEAASRKGE